MSEPKRIQLRHTKGWRKPEGAVVVSRPSKWGNPFRLYSDEIITHDDGRDWWCPNHGARKQAVLFYREALLAGDLTIGVDQVRAELAGKDLTCWCKPTDPCHADVLLEIANGTQE